MDFIKFIKKQIKKIRFFVFLKKKIWMIFKIDKKYHSIFTQNDYFKKIFEETPNFKSLSTDIGLIKGDFEGTNFFIKYRSKEIIESHIYLYGLWEPHIVKLISSFLINCNGSIIDIGANIGAISIPLAKKHHDKKFFLFEPHPEIFKELKNNIDYNRLKNVHPINVAISDSPSDEVILYAGKNITNRGLSSLKINHDNSSHEKINVKCLSIDKFFENKDLKIDIMKIDTQGTELQILLSSKKIIQKNKPIIIFEFETEYFNKPEDLNNAKNEILKFFEFENYDLYMIEPNLSYFPKVTLKDYFRGEILALPKFYDLNENNILKKI